MSSSEEINFDELEQSKLVKITSEDIKYLNEVIIPMLKKQGGKGLFFECLDEVPSDNSDTLPVLLTVNWLIGYISFPSQCIIKISPKINITSIFRILFYLEELPQDLVTEHIWGETEGFMEKLVEIFLESLKKVRQRGFLQDYYEINEELRVIRGQISFTSNLFNFLHPTGKIICNYDEFGLNILENRILLTVLYSILYRFSENQKILHDTKTLISCFPNVEMIPNLSKNHFNLIKKNKKNRYYIKPLKLAEMVYFNLFFIEKRGERIFPTYLLDMSYYFEKFFYKILGELSESKYEITSLHATDYKEGFFETKPDIILRNRNDPNIKVILDMKWKRGIKREDLYQIFTYINLPPKSILGVLVYPQINKNNEMTKIIFNKEDYPKIMTLAVPFEWNSKDEFFKGIDEIKKCLETIILKVSEN